MNTHQNAPSYCFLICALFVLSYALFVFVLACLSSLTEVKVPYELKDCVFF